ALTSLQTGGAWEAWRSATVACGPLPAGAHATLLAEDGAAEVALRGVQLVEGSAYRRAAEALRSLVHGATRVAPLRPEVPAAFGFVRSGRGAELGSLPAGTRGLLELERPARAGPQAVRVETRGDYTVAWGYAATGQRRLRLPFVAGNEPMRLASFGGVTGWRLWESATPKAPPATIPPEAPPSAGRLVVADENFDPAWQAAGSAQHLPSALGTNVFVLQR